MASGNALKAAILAILILALVIAIYGHYHPVLPPPPPWQLITNLPAGLAYGGPETTAIAGYYCIESINSSNGYSIQLNALLSNGLWIQDSYTLMPGVNGPFFNTNVWLNKSLLYKNGSNYINAPCAWLVMAINDGYAYFGYSLDGRNIVWYNSYPVGNTAIEPGPSTELVLAGYGHGAQAVLGNGTTLVYLALYYWNGTNWVPAPVGVFLPAGTYTAESVNHAYVYTNGTCGGVVSWPSPINETVCPVPGFKP
jgi:hypothetical protein